MHDSSSKKSKQPQENQRKEASAKKTRVPKASTKTIKSKAGKGKQEEDQDEQEDEQNASNIICLPVANSSATKKAKTASTRGKTTAPLIVLADDSEAEEEQPNEGDAGDDADDDDLPFEVEYSPSSRSTCRRCDNAIKIGEVRVSHVPLFRGKPGYRVYRHLKCAVFTEEITATSDVGGWRNLKKTDLVRLADRIKESEKERQEENEELDPDELVQAAFAGEIRAPPPGLEANLLPFQTEGFSWMRYQEKGGGPVRGGILVRTSHSMAGESKRSHTDLVRV